MKQTLQRFEFLVWLVFCTATTSCWLVSSVVSKSIDGHFVRRGQLIPVITHLLIMKPAWMLFISIPWFLYAVSPKCREPLPGRGMLFTITVALVLVFMITAVVLACILPWLPIYR